MTFGNDTTPQLPELDNDEGPIALCPCGPAVRQTTAPRHLHGVWVEATPIASSNQDPNDRPLHKAPDPTSPRPKSLGDI